jgi:hypothetical protein
MIFSVLSFNLEYMGHLLGLFHEFVSPVSHAFVLIMCQWFSMVQRSLLC